MALAAGNITFVGFNADGNDNIAFVALVDINPGEVIIFEDNEWNGGAWTDTNEGAFSWEATSLVLAGTIVRIDNIGSGTITASTGTAATPVSGRGTNRGIAASDEVIYAYQGSATSPTFITAIANSGFNSINGLLTNTGLTVGVNAIDLSTVNNDADIAAYNSDRSGKANFASYLSLINNPANWLTQDATGDQGIDGIAPDVPFISTAFTTKKEYAISTNTPTVTEGNNGFQTVTFTVSRNGDIATASNINYEFSNTATFGSDFNNIFVRSGEFASTTTLGEFIDDELTGTLNFAIGEKSKTITVDILGDKVFEVDEKITIKIKDAPSGDIMTNDTTTVVIKNDDLQPSIKISDTSVIEGNFGLINNGKFNVTLSNLSYQQVIVNYSTNYGQTNSSDFHLFPGMEALVFQPGETLKTISFGVRGDSTVESNEKFYVNLFGVTNAAIADSQGVGNIMNDDSKSSFFFF